MILAVNYSKTPMIYHKTINNKAQTMIQFGEKANNLSWNVTNYNVMARRLVGGAVSALSNEAMSAYKTLVGGKKADIARTALEQWVQKALEAQKEDEKNYGMIKVNDEKNVIVAYDDWGDICRDAIMLAIPVTKKVKMKGNIGTADGEGKFAKANGKEEISSDHLVWYDTTALINLSSDKELILTRVTGRDYSSKVVFESVSLH